MNELKDFENVVEKIFEHKTAEGKLHLEKVKQEICKEFEQRVVRIHARLDGLERAVTKLENRIAK